GEDDAAPASAEEAQRILADAVDITGTAGEVYLRDHRRIDPPFPPDIKFLANARCGEGAIVAPLYAHGRTSTPKARKASSSPKDAVSFLKSPPLRSSRCPMRARTGVFASVRGWRMHSRSIDT